jgi:D-arabinose 5-phosphate isomerase GutQ
MLDEGLNEICIDRRKHRMDEERLKQDLDFFLKTALDELTVLRNSLDFEYYKDAVELILEAEKNGKRIHVTGIGKPHHISGYLASLLSSTGTPAYFLDGTEATHGSSGQVLPGDVVICISYYGNVHEIMAAVACLKKNGARIIAVTGFEDSWIAEQGDVHLLAHIKEEGDSLKKPPRTSILAMMYMLIGLSIILQSIKHITPQQYVMWHPGGHLGKLDD